MSARKRQAVEGLSGVFEIDGKRGDGPGEAIRELHPKIGELTVERDIFLHGVGRWAAWKGCRRWARCTDRAWFGSARSPG